MIEVRTVEGGWVGLYSAPDGRTALVTLPKYSEASARRAAHAWCSVKDDAHYHWVERKDGLHDVIRTKGYSSQVVRT